MSTLGPTFAELLSDAVDARGLSLGRLRYHLRRRGHDLSVATLSYWKRGVSRPTRGASLEAVAALEEILDLPDGALVGSLIPRIHPDSTGAPGVEALVASLGLSWDDGLTRTAVHDVITLDADGAQVAQRIRETALARRDGVSRFPIATWTDQPGRDTQVSCAGNCLLGRQVRSGSTLVAEIRLPRDLRLGDRWMTELEMRGHTPPTETGRWGRHLTTPVKLLHFTVRFADSKVPLRAEAVVEARGVSGRHPMVVRGTCLELHLQDFGPGSVFLEWAW